ncbi:Synchronized import protein 1 [Madurella mycetomatis]|uniref:Synchronized import protein 1 n=1 Tax=Madurella mycetomatis TaxID=100816 RepID=A0A175VNL7_9PEZI|nr:Synchronized import protein 1 [Madurella mycetomatis]
MGKSRRNRARPNRSDPIAKPVKPPTDPELAKLRESKILPVIRDLQSLEAKSRTAAAGAIANIVQDARCRKLLLREQVVHIVLTETLTDSSIDSRAAGWEILKVLAQEEEADFCVHLYRQDILTAVEHAIKAILETLTATEPPFSKLLKAQQRLVWDITGSLLTLVGLLALAREEILEAIAINQTILRLLFRLASTDVGPPDVFEEALSCLMTLSEDNLQFGQAMINDQETRCYDMLLKISIGDGSRAVLACGVLHNVFSSLQWLDHSPGKDGACDAVLIPSLSRVLEQVTPSSGMTNGSSNHAGITQVALEILASIGIDLQETIEKGNRSPSGPAKAEEEWNGFDDEDAMDVDQASNAAPDEDETGDGDVEEEEDESGDSDIDADMERVAGPDSPKPGAGGLDDLPTLRELIQKAVPQLIRLSSIPINGEESLAIQSHALSALNNISWTISCLEFANGENANIFSAWCPAAKKIWLKTIAPILDADSADLKLATQVTSLAWAVSRSLSGETPSDGTQHRKFISLYHASKASNQTQPSQRDNSEAQDPFQGLGVKCIGVLGSLARDPAPLEVNREVGIFLVTLLSGDTAQTPPADIVEALNQLFDMYGDEEAKCDGEVFWKDGFLKHMEEFLPKLKAMAKGIDKRTQGELRARADEAATNLARFVQYKKKHAPR